MNLGSTCAVILAAGDGTRMKSKYPKVLCEVLFKPMIHWVTDSLVAAGIENGCAVLGSGSDLVAQRLPEQYAHVMQPVRKGTGHAASMARDYILNGKFEQVVVLNGDAPFIDAQVLQGSLRRHLEEKNEVTVISAQLTDPFGYGRILRSGSEVTGIVEEKDASEAQRLIREVSSGAFWFAAKSLIDYFDHMLCDNAQGEYYLPDAVQYLCSHGKKAGAFEAAAEACLGANDRKSLAALNSLARAQILDVHRANGVDIPFDEGVIISPDAVIGQDTRILPGTIIKGRTVIGPDCEIGPNSHIQDSKIGEGCRVVSSYIDSSVVENNVRIGPMSNLRPDCHIKSGVKIGDFVELKNSVVGEKTSVAHLTYIGDSDVGGGCNFGCGVVTVNYDGKKKFRTVVGDNVFIGCNTNLIAPVKVGNGAYTAAGTTVTDNVPDGALVIGRARQIVKQGWSDKRD